MATTTHKAQPANTPNNNAPNPTPVNLAGVANAVAQLPRNKQYKSGQALLVAAHPALAAPTNKSLCTAARGVLRGTGNGCGRGNTYNLTPAFWLTQYKAIQAQRAQAQATAQAAKAQA